jgi:hypothetical protein
MSGPYTGLPGLKGKLKWSTNAPGERHTQLKVTRKMWLFYYSESVWSHLPHIADKIHHQANG